MGDGSVPVRGVVTDSRRARPGDLFIALTGARTDGHEYLRQVCEAGASAALVVADRGERPEGLPCIVVQDTLEALAALARFHLGRLSAKVVGITGTVGKTTAKDFMAQLLGGTRNFVHAAPASYNSECGLPLAILGAPLDTKTLVLEYGVNAPGEMERLLRIAKPDHACVTALTPVHLEGMGNLATIVREKLLLAQAVGPRGAIWLTPGAAQQVPADFESAARWMSVEAPQLKEQSAASPAARSANFAQWGEVELPLYALHEFELAALCARVAWELGTTEEQLRERLPQLRRPEGRLSVHQVAGATIIDDAYNASPAAVKAALQVLYDWPTEGRRYAVLGTMHELGSQSEACHSEVGLNLASSSVDRVFGVGSGGACIVGAATERGFEHARAADDAETVGSLLAAEIQAGDVVLLKASRAEALERILPILRQHLDARIAQEGAP